MRSHSFTETQKLWGCGVLRCKLLIANRFLAPQFHNSSSAAWPPGVFFQVSSSGTRGRGVGGWGE